MADVTEKPAGKYNIFCRNCITIRLDCRQKIIFAPFYRGKGPPNPFCRKAPNIFCRKNITFGIQMSIIQAILIAVSLCADCFAVSLCSSVTVRGIKPGRVLRIALAFAVIQTALLLAGWAFGYLFVGLVEKIAHIIGFLLLLYVGGSMLIEGIKGEEEVKDLNGVRNVIIGGVATSIDALAVGIAQSMDGADAAGILPLAVSVAVVTALSVAAGIFGGSAVGKKTGRWAEIVGGIVLIAIGIGVLV